MQHGTRRRGVRGRRLVNTFLGANASFHLSFIINKSVTTRNHVLVNEYGQESAEL